MRKPVFALIITFTLTGCMSTEQKKMPTLSNHDGYGLIDKQIPAVANQIQIKFGQTKVQQKKEIIAADE